VKRWLALLLGILISTIAVGQQAPCNALILIRTGSLPEFDASNSNHRETVLWPALSDLADPAKATPKEIPNRLLSLFTGLDWQGEAADRSFSALPGGVGFQADNWQSLLDRGYYAQEEKWMGRTEVLAVADPGRPESVHPDALLLASNGESRDVKIAPFEGPWPSGSLLVFEARNWTDARDLANRCQGRAIIAEYVIGRTGKQYGSYWLSGRGWPVNQFVVDPTVDVAGVIRARSLGLLLLLPDKFHWKDHPDAVDTAPRWMEELAADDPFVICGIVALLVNVGFAMFCIGVEERGPIAASIFVLIALSPPAILMLGSLERVFGIDSWVLLFSLTLIGVVIAAGLINSALRQWMPASHPLLAPAIVGLVGCLCCDPQWSVFSAIFGRHNLPFSAEGVGLMVTYLTGTVAFACQAGKAGAWFRRVAVLAVLASGLAGGSWTAGDRFTAVVVPVIGLVCGEGWFRWPYLFILSFAPHAGSNAVQSGFAWAPFGCLQNVRQANSVNLFGYLEFLLYPGVWGFAAQVIYGYIMGGGFIVRQIRRTTHSDPRLRAIPWAAAASFAWAILNPSYLPVSVLVAYAGLLSIFCSAVWTLEP
jgi:hypothetical protein